ncbi:MAG: outer membrane protein assembly factor BamA [Zavarzinella sp.]
MVRTCFTVIAFAGFIGLCRPAFAASPIGKEIAEVVVKENQVRSTASILEVFRVRPGQAYTYETMREGVRRLHQTGWFAANGIEERTVELPDQRIQVILYVKELPNMITDIKYLGADHLSVKELDELTGLRRGMAMSPQRNDQARLNILRKYQEKGRYHASVTLREGNRVTDQRVVFDIVEGPKIKIREVDFKFLGPHESGISSGMLRNRLTISRARIGGLIQGEYNPGQIEHDAEQLTEYYHGLGYLDAKVRAERMFSDDHRWVDVVFHVEEGTRYKVGQVRVVGNKEYSEKFLLGYTNLRGDEFYDRTIIRSDINRIKDLYGYQGRAIAIREEFVEAQPGTGVVNVNYQVMEGPPSRVGRMYVRGNTVTKDSIILRELADAGILPGQVLSYPGVRTAENNLRRTQLFMDNPMEGVQPTIELRDAIDNPNLKDVFVTVREAQTGSFMVGGGINSDAGITGSVVWNERNFDLFRFPTSIDDITSLRAFRGGGQEFRLEAVPGNIFQRYTASWRDPRLFDSPYSLSVSGYYFNRGYNEYVEDRLGGRVTLGRRLDQFWSASLSTRVEGVTVRDLPFNAPMDIRRDEGYSFLTGVGGNLRRDSRDNYLRPTSGSVLDLSYEQVFGDYQFPILTGEFTNFFTTYERTDRTGKHVLAFRSQASWAGDDTPVFERFYGGGFRSIRGFQFRGVGPFENGYNVGGQFAFMNSAEYQIPLVPSESLYLVGFVDSGAVERNFTINDYRLTAGVGLRISMPQLLGPVPLAIDFGFPIVKGQNDQEQIFSFWFGVFGQ